MTRRSNGPASQPSAPLGRLNPVDAWNADCVIQARGTPEKFLNSICIVLELVWSNASASAAGSFPSPFELSDVDRKVLRAKLHDVEAFVRGCTPIERPGVLASVLKRTTAARDGSLQSFMHSIKG